MSTSRVVVADDDVLLREGIASLLTGAGFDVVGEVGDASALARVVREQVPDLVIVDVRMPPTQSLEGLDAAREIRAEFPQIGILVLSAHVEVDSALDLLEDGRGVGYLLKSRVMKANDVVDALQRISEGGSVVDPALVQELVAQRQRDDPLAELTPREREVLALWRRATPTSASRRGWSSPRAPSRSTSAASSASCGFPSPRTHIGACSRS